MRHCCQATARHFGDALVARESRSLERNGPGPTTSGLVQALAGAGVEGAAVLDVGAGLGAASEGLLAAGAQSATLVEVSLAYSRAARERATSRGLGGRVEHRVGDFVTLAPELEPADVVVLDRVVCCDPRVAALLEAAAGRARRLLGVTYPRDRLSVRAFTALQNLVRRLRGEGFRVWVHPEEEILSVLARCGFRRRRELRTFAWEIAVYEREAT